VHRFCVMRRHASWERASWDARVGTGLLLGGGIEYAFAPNWSARLEYDHVGYLSRDVDLTASLGPPIIVDESATTNVVKAGINYKFFGPSGAIVARD